MSGHKCAWYVLRYPRSDSGACGRRAKYMAVNYASTPVVQQRVCGTHATSAARLGWDLEQPE